MTGTNKDEYFTCKFVSFPLQQEKSGGREHNISVEFTVIKTE